METNEIPDNKERNENTRSKKAWLDTLTNQVADAQQEVDILLAIQNSLNVKSQNFQQHLTTSEADKTQALNNEKLGDQIIQQADALKEVSQTAFNQITDAEMKAKSLASGFKNVVDKLIFSADLITGLSNVIIREKALNPLISDELVTLCTSAAQDASNAVALALVALKSTFAAQTSTLEAEAAVHIEYLNSKNLCKALETNRGAKKKDKEKGDPETIHTPTTENLRKYSIKDLLQYGYSQAEKSHNEAESACKNTTNQLNAANANLNKAQIKLKSLQASLEAANAAALAS